MHRKGLPGQDTPKWKRSRRMPMQQQQQQPQSWHPCNGRAINKKGYCPSRRWGSKGDFLGSWTRYATAVMGVRTADSGGVYGKRIAGAFPAFISGRTISIPCSSFCVYCGKWILEMQSLLMMSPGYCGLDRYLRRLSFGHTAAAEKIYIRAKYFREF